jgi:hypothetical protein
VDSLLTYGGFLESNSTSKLECFGANGVTTFQGPKTSVTVQLKKKHTAFMLGVQILSRLTLVTKIKLLL